MVPRRLPLRSFVRTEEILSSGRAFAAAAVAAAAVGSAAGGASLASEVVSDPDFYIL